MIVATPERLIYARKKPHYRSLAMVCEECHRRGVKLLPQELLDAERGLNILEPRQLLAVANCYGFDPEAFLGDARARWPSRRLIKIAETRRHFVLDTRQQKQVRDLCDDLRFHRALEQIVMAGRDAARTGQPAESCPYSRAREKKLWLRGYRAGLRDSDRSAAGSPAARPPPPAPGSD